MSTSARQPQPSIVVQPSPSECPLFVFTLLVSLALWVVLTITIGEAVYAAIFALIFFVTHMGFVAYVRGSAVRLGPEQFPELHSAVVRMADRIGLNLVPEAYTLAPLAGAGLLRCITITACPPVRAMRRYGGR